jgi:hypothetical protein
MPRTLARSLRILPLLVLALGAGACDDAFDDDDFDGPRLPTDTIYQNQNSILTSEIFDLIRDEDDLDELWRELGGPGSVPDVDFGDETVVVLALGIEPCSAKVDIEAVRWDGDDLLVQAIHQLPNPGCICVRPASPVHVVAVPGRWRDAHLDLRERDPQPGCG